MKYLIFNQIYASCLKSTFCRYFYIIGIIFFFFSFYYANILSCFAAYLLNNFHKTVGISKDVNSNNNNNKMMRLTLYSQGMKFISKQTLYNLLTLKIQKNLFSLTVSEIHTYSHVNIAAKIKGYVKKIEILRYPFKNNYK